MIVILNTKSNAFEDGTPMTRIRVVNKSVAMMTLQSPTVIETMVRNLIR